MKDLLHWISRLDKAGVRLVRIAIAVILIWIGGLKFVPYEADGIAHFVANSPFMRFFYEHPEEYKQHKNKEGELNIANREWHQQNNTYGFSYGLGTLLIAMGVMLLLNKYNPMIGLIGGVLVIIMSLGTLSFLITTPETWVPALGDKQHGFPYLSGAGRMVIKDLMMMAGAVVAIADSAKKCLQ